MVTLCQCSLRRADSRRVWQGKIYRKVKTFYILHIRAGQIFFGQKLQTRQGNLGQKFSAPNFERNLGIFYHVARAPKLAIVRLFRLKLQTSSVSNNNNNNIFSRHLCHLRTISIYAIILQANEIARLIRQYITIDQRNRAINNPSAAAEEKENEEGKQD